MSDKECKECRKTKNTTEFSAGKAVCKVCRATKAREQRERTCPECGVIHSGSKQDLCPEHYIIYRKAVNLIGAAKHRAKKKGIDFDLTTEWAQSLLTKKCPKTGIDFDLEVKGKDYKLRSPYSPSIDKIDPSKGYTVDNCQIVSWWYNVSKQQFTDQEVLEFCKLVIKNQNS